MNRVFDFLKKRGLWDRTLVIVSSDHGESLGEHNYFFEHGKFSYEPCLRVPLIARIPGCGVGTVEKPVPLLDIYPTILDFAGLGPARELEGMSMIDRLTNRAVDVKRLMFAQSGGPRNPVWTVRDETWKLIYVPSPKFRNVMTGSVYELYDLQNDPGETRNLYAPDDSVAMALRAELECWIESKNSPAASAGEVYESLDESTNDNLRALGYIE